MKLLRVLILVFFVGGTLLAAAITLAGIGIPPVDHPQGVSLRQESQRSGGYFFTGYRAHRGGGIANGK